MFRKISFFGLGQKSTYSTPSSVPYSNYQLLTEIDVPATSVAWHRIHGESPKDVTKDGFSGREDFPKDNLKSYIAFNTKFGGFGGTISIAKALEFAQNGANNISNYLYSSVNPNKKISIPAFIRETADMISESTTTSKICEMEVMAVGSIPAECIFYATNELDKFAKNEEVENLMHRTNSKLPATYKRSDVDTPAAILLHLIKTGCTSIIETGIKNKSFDLEEMKLLAKQPEYSKLAIFLEDMVSAEKFSNR